MGETRAITKSVGNYATLKGILERSVDSIAGILPKHLTPERLVKVGQIAFNRSPKLYKCTQSSVVEAVRCAAELGLDFSGTLGRGYLIPYGDQCTFQPGYAGLVDIARRSGDIASISAEVVYQDDQFEFALGLNPVLKHVPNFETERTDDKIKLFYSIIRLKDGSNQIAVMTKSEVNSIRDKSKAWIAHLKFKSDTPWVSHYSEMGKKTVLRRCLKLAPMSVEVQSIIAVDDHAYGLDPSMEIKERKDVPDTGKGFQGFGKDTKEPETKAKADHEERDEDLGIKTDDLPPIGVEKPNEAQAESSVIDHDQRRHLEIEIETKRDDMVMTTDAVKEIYRDFAGVAQISRIPVDKYQPVLLAIRNYQPPSTESLNFTTYSGTELIVKDLLMRFGGCTKIEDWEEAEADFGSKKSQLNESQIVILKQASAKKEVQLKDS